MTFDEWFHKEYEPSDLQIKQYAERKEGLHIPATVYLEDLKKAFEAGMKVNVYTDNSKVIAELEKENAELKGLVNQYKASKCGSISLVNRNMIMSDQLSKAKEIISEFVEWATWQGSNCPNFKSIQDKAEQFLGEVEK